MNITPKYTYERAFKINLSADEFKLFFNEALNIVMAEENREFTFRIDDDNRRIINDMFYYLNYNSRYSGDLNRGILLIGKIGCGKSILMKTILKIIELKCSKIIRCIHSKMLLTEIEDKGLEFFQKRPLYIDDLGKEPPEAKIFGTICHPVEDIISLRDLQNSITFATGNNEMKTYEKLYSKHIVDRMQSLFNIQILKGNSRRKKDCIHTGGIINIS